MRVGKRKMEGERGVEVESTKFCFGPQLLKSKSSLHTILSLSLSLLLLSLSFSADPDIQDGSAFQ